MTQILFEITEEYPPIPLGDEWRDKNGKPTIDYLSKVTVPNASRAKDFEVALNAVCAMAPLKKVKIYWKIELMDE